MARKQGVYWLSDAEWETIQPHLPSGRRGARRVDDRRVISGARVTQGRHTMIKNKATTGTTSTTSKEAFDRVRQSLARKAARLGLTIEERCASEGETALDIAVVDNGQSLFVGGGTADNA